MKKFLSFFLLLLGVVSMSCGGSDSEPKNGGGEPDKDGDDTPQLITDRFLGADLSLLTKYEEKGVVYRDSSGNAVVPLTFLHEQGMNCVRLRLFVNPNGEDGVCQNEAYVIALAKRVKAAGMKFMLDFHYSDTWADPDKQITPAAWKGLSESQLEQKLYDYTSQTLKSFVAAGATPDFVQTGNEISYGLFYEKGKPMLSYSSAKNWEQFSRYLIQAGKAVREVCPKAKIILHIERSASANECYAFFNYMKYYKVDYDIIGLSYYPIFHGTLATLDATLTRLEKTFGRNIMICEFGYNYAWYPQDAYYSAATIGYPGTVQGQRDVTRALITMLKKHSTYVNGLFWWYAEENESLGSTGYTGIVNSWLNRGLFQNHLAESWQKDGCALPALYELKNFISN